MLAIDGFRVDGQRGLTVSTIPKGRMTLRPRSVSRFLAENTLKPTGKVYVTSLLKIALSSAQPFRVYVLSPGRCLSEDSVLRRTFGPNKCRLTGL